VLPVRHLFGGLSHLSGQQAVPAQRDDGRLMGPARIKLVGNGDIWLCHNCGDCSTKCPRGAQPGDVLAAVRAYAVAEYSTPKALGKAINNPAMLPILLAIPAVIFLVVGLLSNLVGLDWLSFAPEGDALWGHDYVNNLLVDVIMIPTFFAAIAVFALGLKRFIADIHANALLEGKTNKQTIEPAGFYTGVDKNRSHHLQASKIQ
jgi:quinone-modifying oxidoreductase subunit QmoC